MLKIYSLNVRGIRNDLKRREIFSFLKRKQFDIIFLQETHSSPEIERKWAKEWGGTCLFSHKDSKSRGVMIAFKSEQNIISKWSDNEGRTVMTEVRINDIIYSLVNVYAPNYEENKVKYFNSLHVNVINNISKDNLIIGGDWNTALAEMDRKYSKFYDLPSRRLVLDMITSLNLIDIWRIRNQHKNSFTWNRSNPKSMSRIDFFIISKNLETKCKCVKILESIHTDHKLIFLEIVPGKNDLRGRGFWKFNNSLLNDRSYITSLEHIFNSKKEEYSDTNDKRVLWDLLKYEIQSYTMEYAIKKAKIRRQLENDMLARCETLYDKLCETELTQDEETEYAQAKHILQDISYYKEQGAQIRSRVDQIEKGEKSNKFFYNKEKISFEKKTVDKLNVNGHEITEPDKILKELHGFYERLYTSREPNLDCEEFENLLNSRGIPQLSESDQKACDKILTSDECFKAVSEMSLGKSPGTDGLTTDFYKRLWYLVGPSLVESLNYSLQKGELSQSQRQGIITLLHKKGKDPTLIKNLRPVSLTNVDYKILTKALAKRTKDILPKIIHEDQSGFIKGRYIGENIRQIDDLIYTLTKQNITGIILMLDFEKAFDSIEWEYMNAILMKFNFGVIFRKWVKICYTNIKSTILNNGFSSGWFMISRGVRQGCPLSTVLFVICVELLAILIRNNKDIKGIKVGDTELKISLFADDTTCLVKDTESIQNIFRITNTFSRYAGLHLNIDKSILSYIGPWRIKPNIDFNVKVEEDSFNILGIELSPKRNNCSEINIKQKIKKMTNKLNEWSQRGLTILGKVLISKSIGMSNLVYSLSNVSCNENELQKAQKVLDNFIWSGKTAKIRQKILRQSFEHFGVKSPDIYLMRKSLRLAWLGRLWTVKKVNKLINCQLDKIGGLHFLLHCNFDPNQLNISDFYTDMFKFFHQIHSPNKYKGILWNNIDIQIGGKTLYNKQWFDKGIIYIKDIIDDDRNMVLPINLIQEKFHLEHIDFMFYNGLKLVINNWLKDRSNLQYTAINYSIETSSPLFETVNGYINVKRAKSKEYYNIMIDTNSEMPTCVRYWQSENIQDYNLLSNSFINYKNSTSETELLSFQYKIIHNAVPTNKKLQDWHIKETDICSYCNIHIDTIVHYLWDCKLSQDVRQGCSNMLNMKELNDVTKTEFLFGSGDKRLDNISLILKHYIYRIRQGDKQLNMKTLEREVSTRIMADKIHMKDIDYQNKWGVLSAATTSIQSYII